MSDNKIILIPHDPQYLPDEIQKAAAIEYLNHITPDADEIELIEHDSVEFFDCGENFGWIKCPSCHAELEVKWWSSRMSDDYADGFMLNTYLLPCCGEHHTLAELHYEWEQGFSRFAISIMNPHIGLLKPDQKKVSEEKLGVPLRVIYQHI